MVDRQPLVMDGGLCGVGTGPVVFLVLYGRLCEESSCPVEKWFPNPYAEVGGLEGFGGWSRTFGFDKDPLSLLLFVVVVIVVIIVAVSSSGEHLLLRAIERDKDIYVYTE